MDDRVLFWGLGGLLGLAGLMLLGWALFYDRAKGRKRCPKCWYDMTHAATDDPLRCPECGNKAKKERHLLKTRRRKRWAAVGAMACLAGGSLLIYPKVKRDGWVSFVPITLLMFFADDSKAEWSLEELDRRINQSGLDPMTRHFLLSDWQWEYLVDQVNENLVSYPSTITSSSPSRIYFNLINQLLNSVPGKYDERSLSSLILKCNTVSKPIENEFLCGIMRAYVVNGDLSNDARRSFVKFVVSELENEPSAKVSNTLVHMLQGEWPESSLAVPSLVRILELEGDDPYWSNYQIIMVLSQIGPEARGAVGPLFELISGHPRVSNLDQMRYEQVLGAIQKIDPQNPRLKEIMLEFFVSDREFGHSGGLIARLWTRSNHEPNPLMAYMDSAHTFWPDNDIWILHTLKEYGRGGDQAARLIMDIFRLSEDTGRFRLCRIVLRSINAYPEDVIAQLEAMSNDPIHREWASLILTEARQQTENQ